MIPEKHGSSECFHILKIACTCSSLVQSDIALCTLLVTYQDLAKFLSSGMVPEPCNTHKYLYSRWSTFADRLHHRLFHNVIAWPKLNLIFNCSHCLNCWLLSCYLSVYITNWNLWLGDNWKQFSQAWEETTLRRMLRKNWLITWGNR